MISRIELQNFRGFKNFKTEITPITIFGGRNNSGKTSILEAVLFLFAHSNPNCFFQMNFLRHMNDQPLFTPERLWEPLFYDFVSSNELKIILTGKESCNELILNKVEEKIEVSNYSNPNIFTQNMSIPNNYPLGFKYDSKNVSEKGMYLIENNMINIKYNLKEEKQVPQLQMVWMFKSETYFDSNSIAQWFGQLVLNDKKSMLLKALQIFDTKIIDVQTIVKGAFGYLYAIFEDGRKMPVSYMGDGMNRMLNILLGILANPGSIILIDEIENGFHYSMYQKLWELIGSAAMRNNCQIIANTHSRDLLQGAVDGLKSVNLMDKLSYIRLDKKDDIIAHIFDSELIDYALDAEMEVR